MELKKVTKNRKVVGKTGDYVAWSTIALARIGTDIKCVGNRWFMYVKDEGYYMEVIRDRFAPIADDVQTAPVPAKTDAILRRIQHISQIVIDDFRSAVCWENNKEDAVLINAKNCVVRVDLETGDRQQLPHSKKYMFLSRLEACYVEGATCKWFIKTLEECLPSKADRDVILSFAGYILCPDCRLEQALICIGEGACGKSTVMYHGVGGVFGQLAMTSLSLADICDSRKVHQIIGKPLNIGTELKAVELDSDYFKRVVSGERTPADPKYQPQFDFMPTTKLCNLMNSSPRFKDGSDADSRRIAMVFFPNQFKETRETQRKKLVEAERDGIFQLMLEWLPAVIKMQQLPEGSECSTALKGEFNVRNDFVKAFITECFDVGDLDIWEAKKIVHKMLRVYRKDHNHQIDVTRFSRVFGQLYPLQGKWSHARTNRKIVNGKQEACYIGIRLKANYREMLASLNGDSDVWDVMDSE